MPKKIVVNGCSYTQEYHLQEKYRWSNLMGCDINLAHGGGSNDRIFHTTIEYINQNSVDTLVIGWTDPNRAMCYSSKGSRIIITPGHTFDEQLGTNEYDIHKFYYKNLHNSFIAFQNTLNYMIHLQEHCRLKSIKLLYWNARLPNLNEQLLFELSTQAFMSRIDKNTEIQGIKYNKTILEKLIAKLNKDIWIKEFWYGIDTHCKDFPWRDDGHVGEEGSAHWADLVKTYL